MGNTLIPGKLENKFDEVARQKAKVDTKANKLVEKFYSCTDNQIICEVFDAIKANGKPGDIKEATRLQKKYNAGQDLEFNEIMQLNKLYKAVGVCRDNKENEYE